MNMQAEMLAQVLDVSAVWAPVGAGLTALVTILGLAALVIGARRDHHNHR
jgi:hypothetical protein